MGKKRKGIVFYVWIVKSEWKGKEKEGKGRKKNVGLLLKLIQFISIQNWEENKGKEKSFNEICYYSKITLISIV